MDRTGKLNRDIPEGMGKAGSWPEKKTTYAASHRHGMIKLGSRAMAWVGSFSPSLCQRAFRSMGLHSQDFHISPAHILIL